MRLNGTQYFHYFLRKSESMNISYHTHTAVNLPGAAYAGEPQQVSNISLDFYNNETKHNITRL